MEPQIKYALTEDGASIGYWTIGEGRPLIWPHGAIGAASLRAWGTPDGRALIERMATTRMLVRYDARGFGISQEGTGDFSLAARVRDLAAVVDRLGAEQVDLCGYLDSGPAALAFAARHPERIAHLVLWSTTSRGVSFVDDDLERVLNDLARVDFEIYREAFVATVMRSLGIDASAHEYARTLVAGLVTPEERTELIEQVKLDVSGELPNIQAPTLILHRRGVKRPKMSDVQAMAARIPNARLALLDGDAAVPYVGDTEPVVTAIEEFLSGDVAAVHQTRHAQGGLVTILFTDIVGHTEMMQRLGDAKGRDVLREHERITRDLLKQHGGAEVKTMGDGFMASFGSVTSALECAIALQRAFAEHSDQEGEPLHVRVGLNAGEPIEEDGDLFGATVILASRIAAKAEAGEILVPENRARTPLRQGLHVWRPWGVRAEGLRRGCAVVGCAVARGMMDQPQIRYTKTIDGVNIAYLRAGEGPILLDIPAAPFSDVQRLTQSPAIWAATIGFAPGLTYVAYDNRGSGGSDRNVAQFSLETDLLDLEAVVDKLGVDAVTLLAAGQAGPVAIAYAARYPERVDRLVLLGAWAKLEMTPELEAILSMMESNYRLFTDTFAHVIMGFATGEAAREYAELMRGCTSPATATAIIDAHRADDVRDLLPRIAAPALIIDLEVAGLGGLSAGTRYLAANLPNAQLLGGGADWGATVGAGADAIRNAISAFVHGAPIASIAPTAVGTRTILFTDIVGHTEMMQRLGDARGRDVLREHERITRETLKQHGGAEVKTMGDGFMASFGSVTQAMECAIALQRAFAEHSEKEGEPLHVRVGLNAGEPIEEDGDLFGATVILASRIAAKAEGGEILIPEPVRHLLSGKAFTFSDRGEYAMKGFDDAVRLYEVRWRG